MAGVLADVLGIVPAILAGGILALLSSGVVAVLMPETLAARAHPDRGAK